MVGDGKEGNLDDGMEDNGHEGKMGVDGIATDDDGTMEKVMWSDQDNGMTAQVMCSDEDNGMMAQLVHLKWCAMMMME